jgi:hypothetical protein
MTDRWDEEARRVFAEAWRASNRADEPTPHPTLIARFAAALREAYAEGARHIIALMAKEFRSRGHLGHAPDQIVGEDDARREAWDEAADDMEALAPIYAAPAQPAAPATLPAQLRAEALRRGPLGESFIGAMPDMPEPAPVTYRAGTVPPRIDVGMVLQCPIGGTWRAVALGCDEVVFRLDHDTDEYGEGRLVLMGMASVSWWPLARDWTEPGGTVRPGDYDANASDAACRCAKCGSYRPGYPYCAGDPCLDCGCTSGSGP